MNSHTTGYEPQPPHLLKEEQRFTQASKCTNRLLEEYDRYVFPTRGVRDLGSYREEPSPVIDMLAKTSTKQVTAVECLAEGLAARSPDRTVVWADMGGGRGLALRQMASFPGTPENLKMVNVDILDWGLAGLKSEEVAYLEELAPGMTSKYAAPELVQDNIETIHLSAQPDLVTSIESIQYTDNPLGAIASWYNQLASDGVVVVSSDPDWSEGMAFPDSSPYGRSLRYRSRTAPAWLLLEGLSEGGVDFAACDYMGVSAADNRYGTYATLAIRKRPDTIMQVETEPIEVRHASDGYKIAVYAPTDRPIVVGPV